MAVNALNITTGEIVWTYKGMQKLSELVGRGGVRGCGGRRFHITAPCFVCSQCNLVAAKSSTSRRSIARLHANARPRYCDWLARLFS